MKKNKKQKKQVYGGVSRGSIVVTRDSLIKYRPSLTKDDSSFIVKRNLTSEFRTLSNRVGI